MGKWKDPESDPNIWNRIREAKKHADPSDTDPVLDLDPKHCAKVMPVTFQSPYYNITKSNWIMHLKIKLVVS
jgi:hypothetical protein